MSTVTKATVYSRTDETPETPSLAAIDRFLDAVWMERGLSPNTLSAYRADLTALDRWLQARGSSSVAAKRADLLAFIAWRVEAGARPRSTARQLSSFRRFYRYLVRDGRINIVPEGWCNSYYAWMENIKDWCISRQIWWGHQIPAAWHLC